MVSECVNLDHLEEKKALKKTDLVKIQLSELPKKLPDLRTNFVSKDNAIAQWLKNWIEKDLESGNIQENYLLPTKNELALHFGVSVGTVQNAIRYIEDEGYVESKQRIGTLIRNYKNPTTQLRKLKSKREGIIVALKKLIIENSYKVDEPLPSSRVLSNMLSATANTTRLALEYLASTGVILSKGSRGNKANWILKEIPTLNSDEKSADALDQNTLVDQVEKDLKDYISANFKSGDKLPSHFELSETLKVSIKTVHDAIKRLSEQGILISKRGRYGTTIARMPYEELQPRKEYSIFASAQEASFYSYEKVEKHIKKLIAENYSIGDKLPSMEALAESLDVSSNTIRKALQKLSKEGILVFSRGRYGGTFINKKPAEKEVSAFTWLAINPAHVSAYKN